MLGSPFTYHELRLNSKGPTDIKTAYCQAYCTTDIETHDQAYCTAYGQAYDQTYGTADLETYGQAYGQAYGTADLKTYGQAYGQAYQWKEAYQLSKGEGIL